MTLTLDLLFKEGFLQTKVVLFAEKTSHATIGIFDATDRGALRAHPFNVEPSLFERLFETLRLTCCSCHFLGLAAELSTGIIHRNHCVFLFPLPSSIGFIHVKCTKSIWPK